jgi:glycosyltransferase involved in cell wall biosynthesis
MFVFIGPRTRESKAIFQRYKDPRILEIGTIQLDEKSSAFAACDIFILPSSQESFGGVFVEAWMFKKPVVGIRIPSVSDVIDNGKNGLTVNQSSNEIANALITLLSDNNKASQMGHNGFGKAHSMYIWDNIVSLIKIKYEEVIKRHTSENKLFFNVPFKTDNPIN